MSFDLFIISFAISAALPVVSGAVGSEVHVKTSSKLEVFIEHIPRAVMSVYRPGCMQFSYNRRDISADAHRTGRLSRILCSCMAISKVWE